MENVIKLVDAPAGATSFGFGRDEKTGMKLGVLAAVESSRAVLDTENANIEVAAKVTMCPEAKIPVVCFLVTLFRVQNYNFFIPLSKPGAMDFIDSIFLKSAQIPLLIYFKSGEKPLDLYFSNPLNTVGDSFSEVLEKYRAAYQFSDGTLEKTREATKNAIAVLAGDIEEHWPFRVLTPGSRCKDGFLLTY